MADLGGSVPKVYFCSSLLYVSVVANAPACTNTAPSIRQLT